MTSSSRPTGPCSRESAIFAGGFDLRSRAGDRGEPLLCGRGGPPRVTRAAGRSERSPGDVDRGRRAALLAARIDPSVRPRAARRGRDPRISDGATPNTSRSSPKRSLRSSAVSGRLPPPARVADGAPDEAVWLDLVWRDIDNFRAAFEWARLGSDATLLARLAVALATFFEDFGDHREGGAWFRAAEERADALEPGHEPTCSSTWPTTRSGTAATVLGCGTAMPSASRSANRSAMRSERPSR